MTNYFTFHHCLTWLLLRFVLRSQASFLQRSWATLHFKKTTESLDRTGNLLAKSFLLSRASWAKASAVKCLLEGAVGRVCRQLYLRQPQRVSPGIVFPIHSLRVSPRRDPGGKKGVRIWGANFLKCQVGRWSLLYRLVCAQHFRNRGAICKIHSWLQFRASALSKQRYFEGDRLRVVAASWCRSESSASSLLPSQYLKMLLNHLAIYCACTYINQSLGSLPANWCSISLSLFN